MSWCHNGIYTQYIHTKYLPYMYLLKTGAPGGSMSQVIPFSIFESVNICLKHFVKVSAVDKGRFRFTISWHIIVSDFVTAFRRSISLLVMFGLLIKVFIERQFCFTFARSMWFLVPTWRRTSLLSPWAHAMSMAQTVEWKNVSPFFDAQIKFHVS